MKRLLFGETVEESWNEKRLKSNAPPSDALILSHPCFTLDTWKHLTRFLGPFKNLLSLSYTCKELHTLVWRNVVTSLTCYSSHPPRVGHFLRQNITRLTFINFNHRTHGADLYQLSIIATLPYLHSLSIFSRGCEFPFQFNGALAPFSLQKLKIVIEKGPIRLDFLSNLQTLTTLTLQSTSIAVGQSQLQCLTNLQKLNLQKASTILHSGLLPTSLTQLVVGKPGDLAQSYISLPRLTRLRILRLNGYFTDAVFRTPPTPNLLELSLVGEVFGSLEHLSGWQVKKLSLVIDVPFHSLIEGSELCRTLEHLTLKKTCQRKELLIDQMFPFFPNLLSITMTARLHAAPFLTPWMTRLTTLTQVDFSSCELEDGDLDFLPALTNLLDLTLVDNQLTVIPTQLTSLSSLQRLDLRENAIPSNYPLPNLPNLKQLLISSWEH